jgi:hypothetical protein
VLLEPLTEIFKSKAEQLNDRLCEIRDNLANVAQNTEAEIARTQRKTYSIIAKAQTGEAPHFPNLRNNTGNDWIIRYVSSIAKGELFKGVQGDAGFLWAALEELESDTANWFIPAGGILIWVPNRVLEDNCVNLEVEELVRTPRQGKTGKSEEHVSLPQREPTLPSGHPLDEATAPPRL